MTHEKVHEALNKYLNDSHHETPTYADVCDFIIKLITATPEITQSVAVSTLQLKLGVAELDIKNLQKLISALQLDGHEFRDTLRKINRMSAV